MNDAGYTLVETLVALVMIGLAIGGLTVGVGVIAGAQARASHALATASATQAAQAALERALQPQGAFRAHDGGRLTGGATGFAYDCGEAKPCRVEVNSDAQGLSLAMNDAAGARRIALRQSGPAHFVYQGSAATLDAWPPRGPLRQSLRSVLLVRDGEADHPLLTARLWAEQPGVCDFDVVMQDCR